MTGRQSVPELPVPDAALHELMSCADDDGPDHVRDADCVRHIAGPVVVAVLRDLAKLPDREKRGTFRDVLRARADAWEAAL